MDVLFRLGRATAEEVIHELAGGRGSSTVRTQLRVLERKGHVRHEERGRHFVYSPSVPRRTARKSTLRHVIDTFFDGSVEQVVAALLRRETSRVSDRQLDRVLEQVSRAKKQRREARHDRGRGECAGCASR